MTRGFLRFVRRNAIGLLALFVALGGTTYAASSALLPNNSVGTKQVINGSLLTKDLSKKARAALKGNRGPRGFTGARGAQGASGAPGAQGPKGDTGAPGTPATKLFAVVQADGTLVASRSSGVVSVTKDVSAGTYRVYFNQTVSTCAAVATPSNIADAPETIQVAFQGSPISGGGLTDNGFFIQLANNAGTLTDTGFHIAVFC
jgi:hypothetical protein